jgi:hypothetical protein
MKDKKPHQKPTKPFGVISFSKDGKVRPEITHLSNDKQTQELEAITIFVDHYNRDNPELMILGIEPLLESDHDFKIKIDSRNVFLQLTELTTHQYHVTITKDEYDSGKWKHFVQTEYGALPKAIDMDNMVPALTRLIGKKIEKNYSKGKDEIWLVVFTTDTSYPTEFYQAKELKISDHLKMAREYVATNNNIFSQIWFTNMVTKPIKIG